MAHADHSTPKSPAPAPTRPPETEAVGLPTGEARRLLVGESAASPPPARLHLHVAIQGFRAMDVGDDVLGLVLERIDSHVSLIRAAAVCKRWRRAIAGAAFLRRYRSLHAPAVAGDYYNCAPLPPLLRGAEAVPRTSERTGPVFFPSSTSMDASHFSLDFLPDGAESWAIVDSRGSLLLMCRTGTGAGYARLRFPDRVVCQPLTRRYRRVHPPPNFNSSCHLWGTFLVDGDTDEEGGRIGMSNFRVMCMLCRDGVSVTTVSSDAGSSWTIEEAVDPIMPEFGATRLLGRAGCSWYFYAEGRTLIVLDGCTGEFSSSQLPSTENWDLHMWNFNFYVTDNRDSKPRIFTVFDENMKVFAQLDGDEWVQEKMVVLSEAARSLPGYQPSFFTHPQNILTSGAGFVILSPQFGGWWPYSVDLETMEVAPAEAEDLGQLVFRCELPWPPALHVCVD
ncbi:hypothetical protein ACP70R_032400 [Stipagrostis hirtigluma subsp. patula]